MSAEKFTILIVDDEEVIRDLLNSFFIKKGLNPIAASNGEEAIQYANREKPDVVLLDIKMPQMDGHQTCQRLRDITSPPKPMGIIMITGYGSINNKEKAIESGADDLMDKPLDLYELIYRIRVWADVREMNDQMERIATYAFRIRQYNKREQMREGV